MLSRLRVKDNYALAIRHERGRVEIDSEGVIGRGRELLMAKWALAPPDPGSGPLPRPPFSSCTLSFDEAVPPDLRSEVTLTGLKH